MDKRKPRCAQCGAEIANIASRSPAARITVLCQACFGKGTYRISKQWTQAELVGLPEPTD